MWKKLLKYSEIAKSIVNVDIQSGELTSFWFDSLSEWGRLIENTGLRGCIDLAISINSSVGHVLQTHRRRRHRADALDQIE